VVRRTRLAEHEPLPACLLDELELLEHLVLAAADLHAHSHGVRSRGRLDGLLEVLQPLFKDTVGVWGVKDIAVISINKSQQQPKSKKVAKKGGEKKKEEREIKRRERRTGRRREERRRKKKEERRDRRWCEEGSERRSVLFDELPLVGCFLLPHNTHSLPELVVACTNKKGARIKKCSRFLNNN